MSHIMTISQVVDLPYSNLNRDENGIPKRIRQGGAMRSMLSSQSIKRAARSWYEEASQDMSVRSGNLVQVVMDRAGELNPDFDAQAGLKFANKVVGSLTKKGEAKETDASRSSWMSSEEIEAASAAVAFSSEDPFITPGATGSLAIAAFGRMFANAVDLSTEAAIAVSPAIATHPVRIETDYFSTVDDAPSQKQGAGATFIGVQQFTTATMYRTVTIDKRELASSWTGYTRDDARAQLAAMVRALILALPSGKNKSTAPYTLPQVILAQEQSYRVAYDFETPVDTGQNGGFVEKTVAELFRQDRLAHDFDPSLFGVEYIAGVNPDIHMFESAAQHDLPGLIDNVVDWILS